MLKKDEKEIIEGKRKIQEEGEKWKGTHYQKGLHMDLKWKKSIITFIFI